MNFIKGQKGFTLIELLIVIAVLGILAGVAVPNVFGFITSGKVQAANMEAANVETAAQAYYGSNGVYPVDSSVLAPGYISSTPMSVYFFNDTNGKIGQDTNHDGIVDADEKFVSVGTGNAGLVFDISSRQWVKGDDAADNGTQDKP